MHVINSSTTPSRIDSSAAGTESTEQSPLSTHGRYRLVRVAATAIVTVAAGALLGACGSHASTNTQPSNPTAPTHNTVATSPAVAPVPRDPATVAVSSSTPETPAAALQALARYQKMRQIMQSINDGDGPPATLPKPAPTHSTIAPSIGTSCMDQGLCSQFAYQQALQQQLNLSQQNLNAMNGSGSGSW